MQSQGVVERHDIISDIADSLVVVGVVALPDAFHLQIEEESLHDGVVPTITLAAHAQS